MMGVTHVLIGTMSAVLLTELSSPQDCLAALAGGAVGGILCDIDIGRKNRIPERSQARGLAGAIVLSCLLAELYLDTGLIAGLQRRPEKELGAGVFGLLMLCAWGMCQSHRGGTHSVLMVALIGMCTKLVCAPLCVPVMAGMASHLILDLLNSKPIQLLYPLRRGVCLGICRADGWLNRWLQTAGLLGTVFGLGIAVGSFS